MKTQTLYPICLVLALAPLALTTAVVSQPSSSSWLEQKTLTNWNKPGAAVPKAPNNTQDTARCQPQIRNAVTPEERAVQSAGWTLYKRGDGISSSGISLIQGLTGFDGMCRASGYQEFVFVDGVFAGTTSPKLMNSRTDSSLWETDIKSSTQLIAQFARYTERDPLCCASRISTVTYRIERVNVKRPLVVPIAVKTSVNSR